MGANKASVVNLSGVFADRALESMSASRTCGFTMLKDKAANVPTVSFK
jgi:hypothetical protein